MCHEETWFGVKVTQMMTMRMMTTMRMTDERGLKVEAVEAVDLASPQFCFSMMETEETEPSVAQ